MSNPIAVTPPRVPFLDKRTGDISREWFMLFQAIVLRIGGANGMSADDLAIGPLVGNSGPSLDAMLQEFSVLSGTAPAVEPVVQYDVTPVPPPSFAQYDDIRPVTFVGTLGVQDSDNVSITGGTIGLSAGTVAEPSFYLGADRGTGFYRIGLNNWGFAVNSVKAVDITAVRHFGIGVAPIARLDVAQSGGSRIRWDIAGATVNSSASNAAGAAYAPYQHNAASHVWTLDGATPKLQIDAGGLVLINLGASVGGEQLQVSGTTKIYGDLSCNGAFGCNGKAAQTSVALGFAAGDLPTVIVLANNMRAALIANGIGA